MINEEIKKILLILSVLIGITSCKTVPEKKIDSAYVMIYDYENNEVMNVALYVDGNEIGRTDIYGRLMFPVKEDGEHVIKAVKEGYEVIEQKMFIKPGILIYFKIGSGNYYAREAEKLLDEKKYNIALSKIITALKIEEREDWKYLKKVIEKKVEE